jgi:hypothetical protein
VNVATNFLQLGVETDNGFQQVHPIARETSAFRPGRDSAACEACPISLPFFNAIVLEKLYDAST